MNITALFLLYLIVVPNPGHKLGINEMKLPVSFRPGSGAGASVPRPVRLLLHIATILQAALSGLAQSPSLTQLTSMHEDSQSQQMQSTAHSGNKVYPPIHQGPKLEQVIPLDLEATKPDGPVRCHEYKCNECGGKKMIVKVIAQLSDGQACGLNLTQVWE